MSDDGRIQELLEESVEIQKGILRLLVRPIIEAEKTQAAAIVKLSSVFGFSGDLISEVSGAPPDNIRMALKRAAKT